MGRAPCCDKANVKRGPWSPQEDAKLKSYMEQNGTGGNWIALPQKIGLNRCGKSCRLRWLNYLRPNIKHGGFSDEEDRIILSLYISIGSRWSIIAAQLPGRTDNDIKNYWNTRLKKKLLGKQMPHQQSRNLKHDDNKNIYTNDNLSQVSIAAEGSSSQSSTTSWSEVNMSLCPKMASNQMSAARSLSGSVVTYPSELDEMFIFNQVKLEDLDNLYGEIIPNWTEVTELINSSLAPCLQEMQQFCSPVDEEVHVSMQ